MDILSANLQKSPSGWALHQTSTPYTEVTQVCSAPSSKWDSFRTKILNLWFKPFSLTKFWLSVCRSGGQRFKCRAYIKLDTVLPTTRHRCDISSKGDVLLGRNDNSIWMQESNYRKKLLIVITVLFTNCNILTSFVVDSWEAMSTSTGS